MTETQYPIILAKFTAAAQTLWLPFTAYELLNADWLPPNCITESDIEYFTINKHFSLCWRYVVEAYYPYAKLIFGRPLHVSILHLHERQEIIITKEGCLPTYLHKCCQRIRSCIRFTYLFTRCINHWTLCNNVEFSGINYVQL